MARSKKRRGLKRVTYSYSRAWAKPQVKLLHLVVFAVLVGAIGYQVLFSKAEGPLPTGANEIVAEYDLPLKTWQATKQADGSTSNLLPAGEIILTGNGNLYCNTAGTGMVTQSNVGPGVVKQVYATLTGTDVQQLVAAQKAKVPDFSSADPNAAATLTVHTNAGAWGITNIGDNLGVFNTAVQALQTHCQNQAQSTPVADLPYLVDVNMPKSSAPGSAVGAISRALFQPVSALSWSYNTNEANWLDSTTNNYRTSHGRAALYFTNCLWDYYSWYPYYPPSGADPWTNRMTEYQYLSHDPNLGYEVNKCSNGSYRAYGQNVGSGPSISAIWYAYLASPEHYSNIMYSGYNRFAEAVNDDSNGKRWTATNFAWY